MAVVEILFNTVRHARVVDIIMETVREHKDHIAILHIFVLEHISFLSLLYVGRAALIGEVVCHLLRWRTEVHLKCVIGAHMEKSVARVTKIGCLDCHVLGKLKSNDCGGALELFRCSITAFYEELTCVKSGILYTAINQRAR